MWPGPSLFGWWGLSLILHVTKPCEAAIISISAVEQRQACLHRPEYSYLAKPRCLCTVTPGLRVSHRTEDSSATEVIPALTASRWVSWSPAILRDSSVFGRSLLSGPYSNVFNINSQSAYINTFLKFFLQGVCHLCLLFCLSACFGEEQWQHPLERETRKRESRTTRKKRKVSWPRF